jgi:hypothetical protein
MSQHTPPQAILNLIQAQAADLIPLLVPHFDKWSDCWTIALQGNPECLLRSEIAEMNGANIRFNHELSEDQDGNPTPDGAWEEGKPEMEESDTTYWVGEHELTVPDDFNDRIVRYH